MKSADDPETVEPSVLDRLGIAEDPMAGADPVSFLRSLGAAAAALVKNPAGVAAANTRLAIGLAAAMRATGERAIGRGDVGPGLSRGRRQALQRPGLRRQPALLSVGAAIPFGRPAGHRASGCGRPEAETGPQGALRREFHRRRARRRPTRCPATRPPIRQAFDTGGKSLARGAKNMVDDFRHNGGWPSQVDTSGFEVGRQHGGHSGSGRVPERPDRADPVRAAGRAGARGAAVVLPAVDQQVLHHGPGAR